MQAAARVVLLVLITALGGCAGVQYKPVAVDEKFWQDRQATIGIAAEKLPQADAEMVGAQGLLDVAINRGNAANMIEHLKKLDLARAAAIPENLAGALERRGFNLRKLGTLDVATFPEFKPDANPELYAPRDFRSLAGKGIDRLLLVTVEKIGTTRSYYAFMPMGAPRALFAVRGQLVDLKTNRLIWYDRQQTTAVIPEPWEQEPDFPNLSAAVMRNMAEGAALIERSLFASPGSAPAAAEATSPAGAQPAAGEATPAAPALRSAEPTKSRDNWRRQRRWWED